MSAPDADERVLQEDVREGLLRGVRADVALRNFGQCFSTPEGSLAAMTEGDLAMSVVTKKLDDFISHDWQTRRWSKVLALCVIYNGDAALCGSCAVALLLTALQNQPLAVLPKFSETPGIPDQILIQVDTVPWGFFYCLVTFWLLLLFGQRIRATLHRGRMVFLDRLCINQLDEEEKCEGIASLAGFMRHSDRLVVLWSPRYFTRLWCVYEMATWLHLGRDLHSSMAFMPVGFAVGLVLLNISFSFLVLFMFIGFSTYQASEGLPVGLILGMLLAPWQVHTLRCLESELRQLVNQLEQFSIQNANCWCCSQAHTHPVSGERLPCDRALVHRTLHARRGGAVGVAEVLEQFDVMVRTTFKDAVSAAFGVVRINYRQALMVAAPIAWAFPELCSSVDRIADPMRMLRYVLWCCVLFLCVFPVTLRATLAAASLSVRACPPRRGRRRDATISVSIALVAPLVGAVQGTPLLWAITNLSSAPQLVLMLVEMTLTVLCFCRPPRCCGGSSMHTPASCRRGEELN